jgi:hypothetical protein
MLEVKNRLGVDLFAANGEILRGTGADGPPHTLWRALGLFPCGCRLVRVLQGLSFFSGKFRRILLLKSLGSPREKSAGTPKAGHAGIGRAFEKEGDASKKVRDSIGEGES